MTPEPTLHLLPPLPYDISSLEPHIDVRTMSLHHDMHHASYVKALNLVLESAPDHLRGPPADWLLRNLDSVPDKIRAAVRNNAGGHVNHSMLWRVMTPSGGGTLSDSLVEALDDSFGSFGNFKTCFEEAGCNLFGSGWVWLVKPRGGTGKLRVLTTTGHDNPITNGDYPLLVNDVWEHAYYLKHENRRPDYLKHWWPIVNWTEVAQRHAQAVALNSDSVRGRTDRLAVQGQSPLRNLA